MGNKPSRHCKLQETMKTVFKSDKDVYRIPAVFYDRDEKILLAFAEKRETANDAHTVALVMRRGKVIWDETSHEVANIEWSEVLVDVVKKADLKGYRPMNPCPVYEKNSKTLFLFFICVEGTVSEQWQIKNNTNKARLCYVTTTDAGQTWSDVTDLTNTLEEIKSWATFAVGPGHGLQTERGTLIVPVYAYRSQSCSCCMCCFSAPYSLCLYSDDFGKNWHFGNLLGTKSLECQMAEIFDESNKSFIYCNARSKGGYRVEAVSGNYGHDFSLLTPPKLVETGGGCQGSVVSFPALSESPVQDPKPKWLLFTHPSDKSKRINLGVYLNESPQDPNAWSKPWVVNRGPSGYSDLVYLDHGWFACLLECGENTYTEQIASVVFSYIKVKQLIPE